MRQEYYQIELSNTKFSADQCDGIVKDCKLFATNCVIIGRGNVFKDEDGIHPPKEYFKKDRAEEVRQDWEIG